MNHERLLIELRTRPLALQLTAGGKVYKQLLTPEMAQSLALALAANSTPELAQALAELLHGRPELMLPEISAAYAENAAEYAARDKAILGQMGVSTNVN